MATIMFDEAFLIILGGQVVLMTLPILTLFRVTSRRWFLILKPPK